MTKIAGHQPEAQDHSQKCLDAALRLLSYRPRGEAELRQRLTQRGFSRETQNTVLTKLIEDGLINDEIFAAFWCDALTYFRPSSKWATKQELKKKGVSPEIIDQVISTVNDDENAYQAGLKKARKMGDIDFETFSRKVGSHLQRRGFNTSVIKHALNKVWEDRNTPPPQPGCSCSR